MSPKHRSPLLGPSAARRGSESREREVNVHTPALLKKGKSYSEVGSAGLS